MPTLSEDLSWRGLIEQESTAARLALATQSYPAGIMARANTPISAARSPAQRKKATTTSAVAAELVTVTPGGSSASSQPLGASQRSNRWPGFMPILRTNGVAVGGDAGVPPPGTLGVTRGEDMPAPSVLAAGSGPSPLPVD